MKSYTVFALLMAFIPIILVGCGGGVLVSGRVASEAAEAISDARVILSLPQENREFEVKSNDKGLFTFPKRVKGDSISLIIEAEGFRKLETLLKFDGNRLMGSNEFRLLPQDIRISGRIVDASDKTPLANVAVTMVVENQEVARSNTNGLFSFRAGDFGWDDRLGNQVVFSKSGYRSLTETYLSGEYRKDEIYLSRQTDFQGVEAGREVEIELPQGMTEVQNNHNRGLDALVSDFINSQVSTFSREKYHNSLFTEFEKVYGESTPRADILVLMDTLLEERLRGKNAELSLESRGSSPAKDRFKRRR